MMTYETWLEHIMNAVRDISSEEFQSKAWAGRCGLQSSPEEIYQILMEDCTPDLFFSTYGARFTIDQMQSWRTLRSELQRFYDRMPQHPNPDDVLRDPSWDEVRRSASKFLQLFSSGRGEDDGKLNEGR